MAVAPQSIGSAKVITPYSGAGDSGEQEDPSAVPLARRKRELTTVGDRIFFCRVGYGLTVRELCSRTVNGSECLTQAAVYLLEAGKRNPTVKTIEMLARAMTGGNALKTKEVASWMAFGLGNPMNAPTRASGGGPSEERADRVLPPEYAVFALDYCRERLRAPGDHKLTLDALQAEMAKKFGADIHPKASTKVIRSLRDLGVLQCTLLSRAHRAYRILSVANSL